MLSRGLPAPLSLCRLQGLQGKESGKEGFSPRPTELPASPSPAPQHQACQRRRRKGRRACPKRGGHLVVLPPFGFSGSPPGSHATPSSKFQVSPHPFAPTSGDSPRLFLPVVRVSLFPSPPSPPISRHPKKSRKDQPSPRHRMPPLLSLPTENPFPSSTPTG